jgi:hypothetical protein
MPTVLLFSCSIPDFPPDWVKLALNEIMFGPRCLSGETKIG